MMFRRALELISRNRVIRRRLPIEFGRSLLYVSPDSALQFLKGSLESQSMSKPLLNFASTFVAKDDVVWDIGANVGVFAFAAAHRVGANGEVVAVEPDFMLSWLLQQSVNVNRSKMQNVRVFSAAVSDKVGSTRLSIAARGRASNSIVANSSRTQSGGARYVQDVLTITLDSLLVESRPPNVVKIDVEGAECMVLHGAKKLLNEIRPLIYIEVGEQESNSVAEILMDASYTMFDGEAEGFPKIDHCTFNTLAIPKECTKYDSKVGKR